MGRQSAASADESLVRQALSAIGGMAWHWDLDRGRFRCLSPMATVPDDSPLRRGFLECLSAEARAALAAAANCAYQNDTALNHEVCIRIASERKRLRLIGSRVTGPQRCLAGVLVPSADANQILEQMLNQLPLLVFLKDLEGRYLFVNRLYAEAFGLRRRHMLGRRHDEVCNVPVADQVNYFEAAAIASQRTVQFDETLSSAEGERYFLSARFSILGQCGQPCAIGGTLLEVTDNRRQQRLLDDQRRRQELLLDSVPSLIWYFDPRGRIQYMNRVAIEFLRMPWSVLAGKTMVELLPHWELSGSLHNGLLEVAASGAAIPDVVFRYEQDGREYWAKVDRIPIKGPTGSVDSILMVVSDITRLRKNEQKLARHNARNRALIANSFESIFCLAFDPPIPLSTNTEERVRWMLKHGTYIDCNEKFASRSGWRIDQVIDRSFTQVMGDSEEAIRILHEVASRDFIADNQLIELQQDGRPRWWEYSFKGNFRDDSLVELWGTMRDVTDAMQESLALQQNEARYRSFIANSHEGIFHAELQQPMPVVDINERAIEAIAMDLVVTECNDEYARHYNYNGSADCVGKYLYEIESVSFVVEKVREFVRNGYQLGRHILRFPKNGDSEAWLSISMEGVIANHRLTGCWGTQRDITERERYMQRLEYQANHDQLTDLPNRQKLYSELNRRLHSLGPGKSLGLILIDLDRFKEINDTLGHHIGDLLLKQLGPRLQDAIRAHDGLVARLGGDEFAVMLANIDERAGMRVAYRLLTVLATSFNLQGFQAEVAASIGVAFCPRHAQDVAALMRYADIAMYQAKTEALGVVKYDPSLDRHTPKRLALMTDLGKAIREDQFCLYFQPKIDLRGRFVRGFEALLRWNHPEHGFLPPAEFIHIAEASEIIRPLTLWVLDAALAQCRRWRDAQLEVKVAVNLSTRNLLDDNIVTQVEDALNRHRVPAKALELEITESTIMSDPKRAAIALQKISALGVNLSVDDFGTGYSSLAYLKRLPVDTLKIDYSFVKDMLVEQQDGIIVNSTINLAHNLGLKVVAEGVENVDVLEALDRMGCDLAQGYYIARPMPANEVVGWINEAAWASLRIPEGSTRQS